MDNEEIDLEYIQGDGFVECSWKAPVVRGPISLVVVIYHKAKGQEVVDWKETLHTEVIANPFPEAIFTSVDNLTGMIGETNSLRSESIPDRGDEKTIRVRHEQSVGEETENQALWQAIRNSSIRSGPGQYSKFIDLVLCPTKDLSNKVNADINDIRTQLNSYTKYQKVLHGVDAYKMLKTATEIFLLLQCGVKIDEHGVTNDDLLYIPNEEAGRLKNWPKVSYEVANQKLTDYMFVHLGTRRLPYIERIIDTVFRDQEFVDFAHCPGILNSAVDCPRLLELIWSYWHEEGGLVQAMNAISLRFQNKRGNGAKDPLAQLEIAPLRPLNNLLWGYIQEERDRLSISRRASEYQHHYGFTLMGKTVPKLRPADNRSKFIEAFHTLLYRAWTYYQEVANTHVVPDGFPLLNSLKEVHLLLAEGAHNQFGDLPWTSRVEMLIQQWLLARPEMQDFLRGRAMVPYKEPWMGPVDTMKKLQGWTDVPVTHFRDLGVFGEQLLLSVRYDNWIDDTRSEDDAKNWANYWKQEAQGYIHAYRAATGADLTNAASARERIDAKMPSVHLRKRERQQARSLA